MNYFHQENAQVFFNFLIITRLFLIELFLFFLIKNKFSRFSMLKGEITKLNTVSPPKKIVVFDLDETLGYFTELSIFWNALENYYGVNLFNEQFYEVLDIFSEFLRPNIIDILNFLKDKKINKECDQIMIYTNNQGPKTWVYMISNYFNAKMGYKLFDKIIAAFKVNGKILEINRTSHDKSVEDLVRCTKIQGDTEICFIDDQYHPLMVNENVYYINLNPYVFTIPFAEMAERYYDLSQVNLKKEIDKSRFKQIIIDYMSRYQLRIKEKSVDEMNAEKVLSKQIIIQLDIFFKKKKKHSPTKRKRNIKYNSTRKKI